MLQKILLVICSVTLLSCSGIDRPKGFICVLDSNHSRNLCMDLEKDFEKTGELKKDAQWKVKPVTDLASLDRHTNFDPDSWASVSGYIRTLRSEYERLKKECR